MRAKLHILLINNGYPSYTQPYYTTYIKSIQECLEEAGFRVSLLVMDTNFKSKISKAKCYAKYYIELLKGFKKIKKFDFVYINNLPYSILPMIAYIRKIPNLIIHWHGDDIFPEKVHGRILNFISYSLVPKNCIHIVPSEYFAKVLIGKLKIEKDRIFILPSGGVDTEIFRPLRKNKKICNQAYHIGFASNVWKRKGFDYFYNLIKDASYLEQQLGAPVFFHYINYGIEKDYYYNLLKNNKKVIIHKPYPKKMMYKFYNKLSVLVFSSRLSESLGLVALEAMACGVPVVGFDRPPMNEYILAGVTGELAKDGDYFSLREKTIKVLGDINIYSPRSLIIKKYSKEFVIQQYKKIFIY